MWVLSVSQHSGTSSPLSEHPASPALLTRSWSTWASWLLRLPHTVGGVEIQPPEKTPKPGRLARPLFDFGSLENLPSLHHTHRVLIQHAHTSMAHHTMGDDGWPDRKAACLGLGSHAPSQFENRSRSMVLPRDCLSCVALPDVSTSVRLPSSRAQLS